MPHLTIQHSPKLSRHHDLPALCEALRQVMAARGVFPVGGIRVRAGPKPAEAIADAHSDNAHADLILRMGAGRTAEVKRAVGEAPMAVASFAEEPARPHVARALETVEIDPDFSWTAKSIHPRLRQG